MVMFIENEASYFLFLRFEEVLHKFWLKSVCDGVGLTIWVDNQALITG